MKLKTRHDYRARRHRRIRKKINGSASCPRLAIMVSNRHIHAQFIDDVAAVTLVGGSTQGSDSAGCNVAAAKALGTRLGALAKDRGIAQFVVDRGGFAYQGRVKAVVDGALEAGLTNQKEEK